MDPIGVSIDEDPTCTDVEYIFEWLVNRVFVAQTGNAMPASMTGRGDEIDVRVTALGGCTPSVAAEGGVVVAQP
jgi:hypothetical protein